MKTKFMTILLSIMMVVTMMPMMAFAEADSFEAPIIAQREVQPEEQLGGSLIEQESVTVDITGTGTEDDPWLISAGESDYVTAFYRLVAINETETIGQLVISGVGNMTDFTTEWNWGNHKTDIKSVVIGSGVKGIGANTFYGCTNITEIELPKIIDRIGASAFEGCTSLSKVDCLSKTAPALGEKAFNNTDNNLKIYASSKWTFENESVWNRYTGNMAKCYSVTTGTFKNGSVRAYTPQTTKVGYCEGETVKVVVNPYADYQLKNESLKANYTDGDGNAQSIDIQNQSGKYEFTYPAADVTIVAEFEPNTTNVCKIGETGYLTVADAVNAVKNNGTITLIADTDKEFIELSRMITFTVVNGGHKNNVQMNPTRHRKLTVKDGEDKTEYKVSYKLIDRPLQPIIDSVTRTIDKIKVKLVDVVGQILKIFSKN